MATTPQTHCVCPMGTPCSCGFADRLTVIFFGDPIPPAPAPSTS